MLYIGDMIFDLQFAQNLGSHFLHFNNKGENSLPKNLVNDVNSISSLIEIKKIISKN
jgi:histidinol phosphatase-like enzyme